MSTKEAYKSRVYTDRPPYADYDAPAKFQAARARAERYPGQMTLEEVAGE